MMTRKELEALPGERWRLRRALCDTVMVNANGEVEPPAVAFERGVHVDAALVCSSGQVIGVPGYLLPVGFAMYSEGLQGICYRGSNWEFVGLESFGNKISRARMAAAAVRKCSRQYGGRLGHYI